MVPLAEAVLPAAVCTWYLEYLDVGEYGLAVEAAAEALPSPRTAAGERLRLALSDLAETMGIVLPDSVE